MLSALCFAGVSAQDAHALEGDSQFSIPVYLVFSSGEDAGEDISSAAIEKIEDQQFTGKKICPKPKVTLSGKTLTEDQDYYLTYENNVDVGTAKVIVTGIGDYSGQLSSTFEIVKGKMSVSASGTSVSYDGKAHSIEVDAPQGAEISYCTSETGTYAQTKPEFIDAGSYTVYYKAEKDGYETEKGMAKVVIGKLLVSNMDITVSDEKITYDGTEKKPKISCDAPNFSENTTVSYVDNVNAGTATIRVTGKGNYAGTKDVTFTIHKRNLAQAKPEIKGESFTYTGSQIRPAFEIKGLADQKDYIYSYADNVNAGTARIVITGIGSCEGQVIEYFTISPAQLGSSMFSLSYESTGYTGSVKTPQVVTSLANGKDYTAAYASGRKYVGTYSVAITGKGNYKGTVTKSFKINPPATSIKSLKRGSKRFTATWTKKTSQVGGYQLMYSTSSKFSTYKTAKITSYKTTTKTIKSLKAKKKYYVKIRTYKGSYYSGWSAVKAVTTR